MIRFQFYSEYSESTWYLVGVAKTGQLGSNERIQEKIEKIKQFARAVPAVSSGDGTEVEGLRDALRAIQMRERELQQQLEDANMRVEQERERVKVYNNNNCITVCNCVISKVSNFER